MGGGDKRNKKLKGEEMKIVDKPWGREIWWAHAKGLYMGKTLEIKNGHKLSLQYHKEKDETIYVLKGELTLVYSEVRDGEIKECILEEGESYRVRPYSVHRFVANRGDVTLLEVSTDYPDDVVRLEDEYGRKGK